MYAIFLLVNLVEEIKQYVPNFEIEMNMNDRIIKEIFSNLVKGERVVSDSQRTLVDKIDKILINHLESIVLVYIALARS
ncbi:MAG: hypothetical protein JJE21_04985 [Spirochaetaceae bacterium]|nr:hypothetical protein [Spirochaetaceae bacterium]